MSSMVQAASVPESSDPIKVIKNDWTGQLFSTEVVGELLKEMGYNIEYVSAGALPQHPGIAQGNLHLQTEVWTNNVGDLYPGLVEKGDIVVDNITHPKRIFGIAAGDGTIKKEPSSIDKENIKKLKKQMA